MRRRGILTGFIGTVSSGKTDRLCYEARRLRDYSRKRIAVFKPTTDTRSAKGFIESRDGVRMPAIEVEPANHVFIMRSLLENMVDAFFVDEIHFFPKEIWQTMNACLNLGADGYYAGLDVDFAGRPWETTAFLLTVTDVFARCTAFCKLCGSPAQLPQRLIDGKPAPYDSPLIQVGGDDIYQPRCYHCHEVPGKPSFFPSVAVPPSS